jgi:uncharacterized RDD family membrane protein YckC
MKCPKCDYLGFDTGDRCKNCGYDFSLLALPASPPDLDSDLILHPPPVAEASRSKWDGTFARSAETGPAPSSGVSTFESDEKLPLFSPPPDDSDEPLVKLPLTPRPPLAVRRTPETPRLRAVPKRARAVDVEPVLQFADDATPPVVMPGVELTADVRARTAARLAARSEPLEASGAWARVAAAAIDHLLLSAIDLTVIYFTVRMAGLPMSEWAALPLAPLAVFLVLVKLSYFWVFTAVGGQTIGKMAMRIRVVTTEDAALDAAAAAIRSLGGTLSAMSLGLGYVPALIGTERKAIHDRLTHTRVVSLPPH